MAPETGPRLGLHPPFIAQNGQSLDEIWELLAEYKLDVIFEKERVTREWFCSREQLFDVTLLPA